MMAGKKKKWDCYEKFFLILSLTTGTLVACIVKVRLLALMSKLQSEKGLG